MKSTNKQSFDCGVIVARFQVDELHDGHKQLINHVKNTHDKVIVFLGLSPCKCTINNPLDFEARKQMLLDIYPDINVLYIKDCHSDELWSCNLDEQIGDILGPNQTAVLYGSRDSFIRYYSGDYDTIEMEQEVFVSGTDVRKRISNQVKSSPDFRKGVIWATQNQWPKSLPTVDIAIFNDDYSKILLGRKKNEDDYRFIGGFVQGETLETTCRREVMEETNIEIEGLEYIQSFVIDDWRYRGETDKITTSLFIAKKLFGKPEPGDDIHELRWFDFQSCVGKQMVENHREMFYKVYEIVEPE